MSASATYPPIAEALHAGGVLVLGPSELAPDDIDEIAGATAQRRAA